MKEHLFRERHPEAAEWLEGLIPTIESARAAFERNHGTPPTLIVFPEYQRVKGMKAVLGLEVRFSPAVQSIFLL